MLLAPDAVARHAARAVDEPEARWMLAQPRAVRRAYVAEVLDRGGHDARRMAWMLRQPDAVRESFVREVLHPRVDGEPDR